MKISKKSSSWSRAECPPMPGPEIDVGGGGVYVGRGGIYAGRSGIYVGRDGIYVGRGVIYVGRGVIYVGWASDRARRGLRWGATPEAKKYEGFD